MPAQSSAGRRLALIAATSTYHDVTLRQLRAPGADADDLAHVLEDPAIGGFEVSSLLDASSDQLLRGIADFCHHMGPADLLLLYLSCHGVLDDRGRLYYATVNTERELLRATAVSAEWLRDELDDCRARQQILLLDCCHSGAFAKGSKGDSDLALKDRLGGRGKVVLTASRATEYSFEGQTVHGEAFRSVFTHAVVDGLRTGQADRDKDGLVTVNDLYQYVYETVKEAEPRQTPELWTFAAEGDLVVAHSPLGAVVTPAPLPEDVQLALESARLEIRTSAVRVLADLLDHGEPGVVVTAHEALRRVSDEDHPKVATLARAALQAATGHAAASVDLEQRSRWETGEGETGGDSGPPPAAQERGPGDTGHSSETHEAPRETEEVPRETHEDHPHETARTTRSNDERPAPQEPVTAWRWRVVSATAAAVAVALTAALLEWHPWSSGPGSASTATSTTSTESSSTTATQPAESWDDLPPLPQAVEGAGAASYHRQLWVVGGNAPDSGHPSLGLAQVYDPSTGEWSQGPSLPAPVGEAGVVSTGDTLYVIGGLGADKHPLSTVWRLDDPNGRWKRAQDLPAPRFAGAAAFDGTQIAFAGGRGPGQANEKETNHREIYSMPAPGGSWQEIAKLPEARDNFAAASDGNGSVWFMGGSGKSRNDRISGVVSLKDGTVTKVADLPVAVRAPAAVWWPGAGACAIAGDEAGGEKNAAVQCVAQSAQPSQPPPVSHPRGGLAAAVVGDHVYTVGGFYENNPASNVAESISLE